MNFSGGGSTLGRGRPGAIASANSRGKPCRLARARRLVACLLMAGPLAWALAMCGTARAQPVAAPATLAVPLNTATSLNLAPFITGAGITGIAIATASAHGSAAVNGTTVTYTPASNFFGTDSFTYVAFGTGGQSAPATVTATISGRPDPGSSAAVTGLLASQFDSARRYSTVQIATLQRRLESLHRGKQGQGAYAGGPGADDGRGAAWRIASAETGWPAGADSGLAPLSPANGPRGNTAADTVNLAALNGGDGPRASGSAPGAPDFWIDGISNFGTREPDAARSGSSFSSSGTSFGMDRRLSEKLVLGVSVGFARDKTEIGADGTRNRARGYSIAAYGSYQPAESVFVDGLLGMGRLDIDTQRFVAPANAFASSNRGGRQVFGSLSAGYEYRDGVTLVSPYARLDYFADRLNLAAETGAGQYALTYFGQTARAAQGVLGIRAESVRPISFGWSVPRARAEIRHAFHGNRLATAAYADQGGGPVFGVPIETFDRDALVLGLGNDLVLRDGLLLGIDFQVTNPFSKNTNNLVWLRLAKDLDARGPAALGGTAMGPPRRLDLQVDAGYVYDDNVTRSRTPGEILFDRSYSVNVTKAHVVPLTDNTRALLSYFGGAETFQNYDGLSKVLGGARGEWQYRGSSEWGAPTFALFARVAGERYESTIRNGFRYSVGASVRQPVTDRIEVFGALAHNERYGKSDVFTNRDNSARINVDYSLSRTGSIYLTGEFRRGDIVSTGSGSLENIDIAKVLVPDDAFPGRQFFSYRIDADTVLMTLGYNIGFGPRDSLDISWRRVESTPSQRAAFSTAASSYIVNQYSLVYLMRF